MGECENNEHEYEWADEYFDHEFGTEQRGHWECEFCGKRQGAKNRKRPIKKGE